MTSGLFALGAGMACGMSFGRPRAVTTSSLADISPKLQAEVNELFSWLRKTGWAQHIEEALRVNLALQAKEMLQELTRELYWEKLEQLRNTISSGYDDFSGSRLIEPGFPAQSLLHHTLASPRVRPRGVTEYPSLAQIDLLENYIYALCPWERLRDIYGIDCSVPLHFAVFAYEYRPAFKTPHHECADLVFSRTGIARIGERPAHYDTLNRCYTNRPAAAGDEALAAVVPARYGLFIARQVHGKDVALLRDDTGQSDSRVSPDEWVLQPIRKVFSNDLLIGEAQLSFKEMHRSEKLKKFALIGGILVSDRYNPKEKDRIIPATRTSVELVEQDKQICAAGSSFLVASQPRPLIRFAHENGRPLYFKVPKRKVHPFDSRNFSALCTQDLEDVDLLEGNSPVTRVYGKYPPLKDQSLFVNITNERDADSFHALERDPGPGFDNKVNRGGYYAPLFEDSICDGRVEAVTEGFTTSVIGCIAQGCVPAFSVVAAPDFFPQVDPLDFATLDIAPGSGSESNFYAGGVASLAYARIPPDPDAIDAKTATVPASYLAVLSGALKQRATLEQLWGYQDPTADRGYEVSGFLPDVASSIFAPGWDVTYAGSGGESIHLSTDGIGLPFIEDMKFCSALNGMWPATSPDAARSYQGANEPDYRSPTAVPLLDHELGISPGGPAGPDHQCAGWDGEHGPYLQQLQDGWAVNFTDLARADIVTNALTGKIDLSKMRTLNSAELIARMECLRRCISALPQKNFNPGKYTDKIAGYTYLWLVSAEAADWGNADVAALGIPGRLVGSDKNWITRKDNALVRGKGYLYVFADTEPDSENKHWATGTRRLLACNKIYVCQVIADRTARHKVAWADVTDGVVNWQVA